MSITLDVHVNMFMKRIIIVALAVISIAASSCASNGYGCRGKSKIITRVK